MKNSSWIKINISKGMDEAKISESCIACLSPSRIMESIEEKLAATKISDMLCSLNSLDLYKAPDAFDRNIPKQICVLCKNNLILAYDFQQMIIQSSEKIKKILEGKPKLEGFVDNDADTVHDYVDDDYLIEDSVSTEIDGKAIKNEPKEETVLEREVKVNESKSITKPKYTCEICKKTFDKAYRVRRHMSVHMSEGRPFECDKCFQRFATDKALIRHLIVHSEVLKDTTIVPKPDVYTCNECNRQFDKQHSLASHIKVHKTLQDSENIDGLTCEICAKPFKTTATLRRHKRTHEKIHKCNLCNKLFSQKSNLIDHTNSTHMGIKPYICQYCQKSFSQACTLRDHVRTHFPEDKPFLCVQCGRAFNNASNLRQHIQRHSGVKNFNCTMCPSKFVNKAGLSSHMLSHTGEKPYTCDICKAGFTKSYSLHKHKRIHTGEKPYSCEVCSMRFTCSDHMKRHLRTHTGEKPYVCPHCPSKAFSQSNDLVKHLRSHLGNNMYQCDMCTLSFRLFGELKKHKIEHYQAQQQKSSEENWPV